MFRILTTILLGLLVATAAFADDWNDCAKVTDEDISIQACTRIIAEGGESSENLALAYSNRGLAYLRKGDQDRAIADYEKAIQLKPDYANAYLQLSGAYGDKGDYDTAIVNLDKAIQLKPYFAEAYILRGLAFADKGDYDRAIADYDKAIQLKPDYAEAYAGRGWAYESKGDYDRAIADLDMAILLKPDFGEAYNFRGWAYERKNDYDRATADYRVAVRLIPASDPQRPELLQRLAAAESKVEANGWSGCAQATDQDLSIRACSNIIAAGRETPENLAMAHYDRGLAYTGKGEFDRAIADYDRAIQLRPDYAVAYYNRGLNYVVSGNYDRAIADYRVAASLTPASDPMRKDVIQRIVALEIMVEGGTPRPTPAAAASSATADLGRRLALVIGINAYRDVPKLEKAAGDARAMADALKSLDFVVTEVIDANRRDFNEAVAAFRATIVAGDTVFVHFSGHGVEIEGENYLLPADVPKPVSGAADLVKSEAIALSDLVARITDAGSTTRIFVIDACRDNPFDQIGVRSVGGTRGLVRIEASAGTFIMYSAGFRQKALDELGPDDVEPTSVYTRVLLKHLNRVEVPLDDIAQDVRSEVGALARGVGHDQRPAYYDELSERFFLAPRKASPDATIPSGDGDQLPEVQNAPNASLHEPGATATQSSEDEYPGIYRPGTEPERPAPQGAFPSQPSENRTPDEMRDFVATVLADTEDIWKQVFSDVGETYPEPTLTLFSNSVNSSCGLVSAAEGPSYCPADKNIYIDLGFFDDLRSGFGAPDDFAGAYVVAHAVGHHVQNVLGILPDIRQRQQQLNEAEAKLLSIKTELQADCFAGIWANGAKRKGILDSGDIETAASAIVDDALQHDGLVPESFAHGTTEQRVFWFRRGYEQGTVSACDSFAFDIGAAVFQPPRTDPSATPSPETAALEEGAGTVASSYASALEENEALTGMVLPLVETSPESGSDAAGATNLVEQRAIYYFQGKEGEAGQAVEGMATWAEIAKEGRPAIQTKDQDT